MKRYELDKVHQDTINSILDQYADRFFKTIGMPGVAIAYRADLGKAGHPRTISMDLTFEEEPTSELSLPLALYGSLKSIKEKEEIGPEEIRFKMQRVLFKRIRGDIPFTIGAHLILLGASPNYSKNDQRDTVDAQYSVDEWGNRLLISGISEGEKPAWMISNYNFNGMNQDGLWKSLNFEEHLSKLEQIAEKEEK